MNLRNLFHTLKTTKLFINKRALLIGTLIFYLLSLRLHYISVPLVIFLFGLLFSTSWTLARRIIFGFVTFLLANIIVSYIFFYLHIPLLPIVLETLYAGIAMLLLLKQKKTLPLTPLISVNELFNFIVPSIVFVFFFVGILHYHNGSRIPILTEGDSAQHFTMTRMAIDQKSLLYNSRFYTGTPFSTQLTYPPGFYINTAILYTSFLNHPYPIQFGRLITLFYLFNYLIIGLILYLASLLIEIHEDKTSSIILRLPILPILCLFTFGYMLLYEFLTGFSAMVFTIFVFLVFLYALIQLPEKRKLFSVSIILALNFVVSASWYVMLPVTLVMSVYYIYRNFSILTLFAGIIALPLSFIPMYYDFLKRFLEHSLGSDFVATSGINAVDYDLLIKLFVFFVIYTFLFRNLKRNFYLTLIVIVSALYSFGVLLMEIYISGGPSYYYYKTLHYVIILLSIVAATSIVQLVKIGSRYIPKNFHLRFSLSVSILLTYFIFICYGSSYISLYIHGNLKVAIEEENMLISLASNQKYQKYEIIPFSSNFLIHLWSEGFFPNISKYETDLSVWNVSVSPDRVGTSELIANYIARRNDKRPILLVDFACYAKTFNNLPKIATLSAEKKIEIYPPGCNVSASDVTPTSTQY